MCGIFARFCRSLFQSFFYISVVEPSSLFMRILWNKYRTWFVKLTWKQEWCGVKLFMPLKDKRDLIQAGHCSMKYNIILGREQVAWNVCACSKHIMFHVSIYITINLLLLQIYFICLIWFIFPNPYQRHKYNSFDVN